MIKLPAIAIALLVVLFSSCHTGNNISQNLADSTAPAPIDSIKLDLVTDSVHFPVELKESPDGTQRLFVCDLSGRIFIVKDGKQLAQPFLDIRSRLEKKDPAPNIKGMFGMTFDPQFATNKKFYISYNAPTTIDSNVCKLVIAQFTASAANPDMADSTSEKRVFELEGHTVQQDAGELVFGPDGYLYISIGDNGTPMKDRHAQELASYLGKLLRIDVHTLPYKIPTDNPFLADKKAKPEIYAYGLRRFWRFTYEQSLNAFIGGDIGDKLREEVDIIHKGGNYGWPYLEGDSVRVNLDSVHQQLGNFVKPVATYGRKEGICVMGGVIYKGSIPYLQNKYVFADFNGSLYYLTPGADNTVWAKTPIGISGKGKWPFIINSYNIDGNGEIYLMGVLNTDKGQQGVVYKVAKL